VLRQPFEGICTNLERRYQETQSDSSKRDLEECMSQRPCPDCGGKRLRKESLAVTVGGMSIYDFTQLSVSEELKFVEPADADAQQLLIADQILKEIRSRLGFLQSVGLAI
jgi:excinuclease ABC subunit A